MKKSKLEKIFKGGKFLSLLVICIMFIQVPSVSASEINNVLFTPLTVEDNGNIGIGKPQIKYDFKDNFKLNLKMNLFRNLNFYYKNIKSDNSIIQNITIPSSNLISTIDIPLSFLNGEYIEFYPVSNEKNENYGNIYNKEGYSIGLVSVEALKNKDNINLTTVITKDNIFRLETSSKLNEDIELQIKFKSTNFNTYFSDSEWIRRGNIESLSLVHKFDLKNTYDIGLESITRIDIWDKILVKHSKDIKWSNTEGLKNQLQCHFDFAKDKSEWNIEPFRQNVGYISTLLASCNPK